MGAESLETRYQRQNMECRGGESKIGVKSVQSVSIQVVALAE